MNDRFENEQNAVFYDQNNKRNGSFTIMKKVERAHL